MLISLPTWTRVEQVGEGLSEQAPRKRQRRWRQRRGWKGGRSCAIGTFQLSPWMNCSSWSTCRPQKKQQPSAGSSTPPLGALAPECCLGNGMLVSPTCARRGQGTVGAPRRRDHQVTGLPAGQPSVERLGACMRSIIPEAIIGEGGAAASSRNRPSEFAARAGKLAAGCAPPRMLQFALDFDPQASASAALLPTRRRRCCRPSPPQLLPPSFDLPTAGCPMQTLPGNDAARCMTAQL